MAGAGRIAGLTEAQVLSIGGALSSVGIEAEAGGTAVQKVLIQITTAVQKGGSELAAFAKVAGQGASEFAEAWTEDAGTAFTDFVEGVGKSGQRAALVLGDLGIVNERSVRAFISLAGAGIYPVDSSEFEQLRTAIEKLTLNDASVTVEQKSSIALGLGFRCGFLGLLHMEVFKQRLEQEYNITAIVTAPSVAYKIKKKHSADTITIESPAEFPDPGTIEEILEPMINATIIVPKEYLGLLLHLCQEKRGTQKDLTFLTEDRVILSYKLPLNEVATDFYDQLKSLSSGYASFDYEQSGYQPADLVKMDILLNGKPVDALSTIVHRDNAYGLGKQLVERLKKVINRQLFEVVIQAAIGAKIIARSSISPARKQVTEKCYGGDITRKRKLLEKQKKGKKKMKQVGSVEVPHEAFLAILKKTDV